jgi:hypothetical protein
LSRQLCVTREPDRVPRLNATVTKPVAETGIRERPPKLVHKERHVTAKRHINDLLQRGEDGQHETRGLPVATLELSQCDLTVTNVLAP